MKPKYALLVLGLITSVISGVLLPSSANAVSAFDNTVNPIDTLTLQNNGHTEVISPGWLISVDNTCNNSNSAYLLFQDILDENISGAYAITQQNDFEGYQSVQIYGTTDIDPYLYFEDWGAGQTFLLVNGDWTDTTYYDFVITLALDSGGTMYCDMVSGTDMGGNQVAQYNDAFRPYLLVGFDIEYPANYEGELIPDTVGEESDVELLRPDFVAQIANKNIIAHDYNSSLPSFTPEEGYSFVSYEIEWSLWQCENSFDDITGMCDEHVLVNYDILPQDSDYTYEVEDYGDYVLEAEYQVQQCYRYPSYPATPDYCFYADLSAILEDYDAVATTKHLLIDGSSYTVDTKELVCTDVGYCQEAENICYEQPDFVSRLQCEFSKQMKVGIINPSLQSVKALLTSLTVSDDPQCVIPLSDVTYSGQTIPLSTFDDSACSFTEDVHSAIPLLSVVTNFILAFSLFGMVIAIVNKLTDEKNHNMIEGL
tara:strand:+ start:985 stop:2430 length:1446 start_codon:yes stop_codon:yes gene_type:complete